MYYVKIIVVVLSNSGPFKMFQLLLKTDEHSCFTEKGEPTI